MVPGWFKSETLSTPLICMLAPQSRFGLVMMMIDDGNGGQGLSHQFSFVHKQRISHRPTSKDGEINLGKKSTLLNFFQTLQGNLSANVQSVKRVGPTIIEMQQNHNFSQSQSIIDGVWWSWLRLLLLQNILQY